MVVNSRMAITGGYLRFFLNAQNEIQVFFNCATVLPDGV